jgi:hypothetical protein
LCGKIGNQWPNGWGCHISITSEEDISHAMSIKKEVIPAEKKVKKEETEIVTILLNKNSSPPFSANSSLNFMDMKFRN